LDGILSALSVGEGIEVGVDDDKVATVDAMLLMVAVDIS